MRGILLIGAAILSLAAAVAAADTPAPVPDTAQSVMPTIVTTRPTNGGTVYADAKGRTLYAFDGDTTQGKSTCTGACAKDWRPLPVAWAADTVGDWSVVGRDDGSRQWAFKGKPLYTFRGDDKPGDTNGEGVGNAWRALVSTRKFLPAGVTIRSIPNSDLGPAFTTAQGMTIYLLVEFQFNGQGNNRYNSPNPGPAGCATDCARIWPPLTAPVDAKPSGDWTVVARDDGTAQWAYRGYPAYTYSKDAKPGDAYGEGVGHIRDGLTDLLWQVATLSS